MQEDLRREVRCLTTRLGAMVQEQCGSKVFAAIETLRRLSKRLRQGAEPSTLAANDQAVSSLTLGEAASVAHAFSLFFHLVNLCEERERIRRLAVYEHQDSGAPMSLRRTFTELKRQRLPVRNVSRLLASLRIELVLTAHPTEAKRRSVFNHILRIGQALESACGDAPVSQKIDPWIEALWLTDEVRERLVTPQIEIENTLVYFERTIYDLAGSFWERFQRELARSYPDILPPVPFFGFGSWVGTDRDGNPNVTPEASVWAAEEHRRDVLRYYVRACHRLLGMISFPCRNRGLAARIQEDLRGTMRRFPATLAFAMADQPSELYRRKLRTMIWRLERTLDRSGGTYERAEEFTRDAGMLEEILDRQSSPRIAALGPRRLRVAAQVFGFHGASLDFRQHASVTRLAAEELLRAAGRPTEPTAARVRSIQHLLRARTLPEPVTLACQKTIREFGSLKEIQIRCGHEASHRYILSMCNSASDIWDVLLLARMAGLIRQGKASQLDSSFDAIPLFET